jgi:transposase
MMQEMIKRQIQNQVKFQYILADSWYSSAENMRFITKRKKVFIFELKENRMVTGSEKNRNLGAFEKLEHIARPEGKPMKVWIKDLEFPVLLFKQVFINKDGSIGQRFLVTNDLTLSDEQFETLYKKRWSVEDYHKSLKQNASIGSSPARTERTQSNHIFSAIYAYTKLEKMKQATKTNHFALKAKIYIASMKTALTTFQELWENTENIAFA